MKALLFSGIPLVVGLAALLLIGTHAIEEVVLAHALTQAETVVAAEARAASGEGVIALERSLASYRGFVRSAVRGGRFAGPWPIVGEERAALEDLLLSVLDQAGGSGVAALVDGRGRRFLAVGSPLVLPAEVESLRSVADALGGSAAARIEHGGGKAAISVATPVGASAESRGVLVLAVPIDDSTLRGFGPRGKTKIGLVLVSPDGVAVQSTTGTEVPASGATRSGPFEGSGARWWAASRAVTDDAGPAGRVTAIGRVETEGASSIVRRISEISRLLVLAACLLALIVPLAGRGMDRAEAARAAPRAEAFRGADAPAIPSAAAQNGVGGQGKAADEGGKQPEGAAPDPLAAAGVTMGKGASPMPPSALERPPPRAASDSRIAATPTPIPRGSSSPFGPAPRPASAPRGSAEISSPPAVPSSPWGDAGARPQVAPTPRSAIGPEEATPDLGIPPLGREAEARAAAPTAPAPPPRGGGSFATPRLLDPDPTGQAGIIDPFAALAESPVELSHHVRPDPASVPPELASRAQLVEAFDESHYRSVFDTFLGSKRSVGETVASLTYEVFSARLRASERELVERHGCRAVRFQVIVKDNRVSLRPQLVR